MNVLGQNTVSLQSVYVKALPMFPSLTLGRTTELYNVYRQMVPEYGPHVYGKASPIYPVFRDRMGLTKMEAAAFLNAVADEEGGFHPLPSHWEESKEVISEAVDSTLKAAGEIVGSVGRHLFLIGGVAALFFVWRVTR